MTEIYVNASYSPSTNVGGWGVVLIDENGQVEKYKGSEQGATAMRMILRAAIEGLSKTEQDSEVKLFSNSEYLIIGLKDSRQRKANRDLWNELDKLVSKRHINVQQIAKHKWLGEAQMLAKEAIEG